MEKKKKEEEEKSKEKEQDTGDLNEWEYLYGALELFTNNRKRSQIVLLHNIIFKIKEEYNKEFEKLMKLRANQLDSLNDKNKRIEEILKELRKPIDIFRPKKNILENPDDKLCVDHIDRDKLNNHISNLNMCSPFTFSFRKKDTRYSRLY